MWFARGGNSEYGEVGSRQNGVVVRWGGNADEGILYGVVMGGGGAFGGSTSDGVFKVWVGSRDGKIGEEMVWPMVISLREEDQVVKQRGVSV